MNRKFPSAIIAGALSLVFAAACGGGCSPASIKAASYAADLEACVQTTQSCEAYLVCRHDVQARYGQPVTGTCEDTSSGRELRELLAAKGTAADGSFTEIEGGAQ